MNIYSDLDKINFDNHTVVTIGNFDGVHIGHRELISRTIAISEQKSILPVMFTFSNHPLEFLYKKHIEPLTGFEQKIEIITEMGIKDMVLVPFNNDIKNMSTQEFAQKILIDKLNATDVVMGFDSRLGSGRQGSVEYLYEVGKKLGFHVHIVPAVMVENMRVSSSFIRELIKTGEVKRAQAFLGRQYMFEGRVTHGKKLGRKLGFPTANLQVSKDVLLPKIGVYFCKTKIQDRIYDCAVSVGYNPTVQENSELNEVFVEVHILDFDEDIYEKTIKLYFVERLRDEIKFDSIDSLIKQLNTDVLRIRKFS